MKWRQRAQELKTEALALYLAYRDPRTPWLARIVAAVVVGYTFSPLDLIPDFIPVLGMVDDLILVPLGIALALRLIPPDVMAESRQKARSLAEKPVNRAAAVVIVLIWLLLAALGIALMVRLVG